MLFMAGILTDALFIALLAWCGVSDLKKREIPNTAILLMLGLGAAHMVISACLGCPWYEYPLGTLLAVPFFIAWTKGLFGGGDVKLVFVMGLYLGLSLTLAAMAFTVVACVGLLLWLWAGKRSVKTRIALAPVLSLGALAAVALGYLF
jgi:Flp pilus assembly protein protease CpaA